jgi:hypothetical protein
VVIIISLAIAGGLFSIRCDSSTPLARSDGAQFTAALTSLCVTLSTTLETDKETAQVVQTGGRSPATQLVA